MLALASDPSLSAEERKRARALAARQQEQMQRLGAEAQLQAPLQDDVPAWAIPAALNQEEERDRVATISVAATTGTRPRSSFFTAAVARPRALAQAQEGFQASVAMAAVATERKAAELQSAVAPNHAHAMDQAGVSCTPMSLESDACSNSSSSVPCVVR